MSLNNTIHTTITVIGMSVLALVLLTSCCHIYWALTGCLWSAWLKKYGQLVKAQVTSIREARGFYVVIGIVTAVWTDPNTNAIYTFERRCFASHRSPYKEGHTIAILIDPENPRRYTMEIGY